MWCHFLVAVLNMKFIHVKSYTLLGSIGDDITTNGNEHGLGCIYCFSEHEIPGASLNGKAPDVFNVEQLKRCLACQGARWSGKKVELVQP